MALLVNAKKFDAFNAYPENLTILGLDRPAPEAHPAAQPLRLAQIKREGTKELEVSIEHVGEVLTPITIIKDKLPGAEGALEEAQVVVWGRRRVLALRAVNKRRVEAGLEPLTLKVVLGNKHDPQIWDKVRAENAGRLPEDPLDMAADVAIQIAAGKSHEAVGLAYGKNHQWSRAMHSLHTKGTPKVKELLREGRIGAVSACEISTMPEEKQLETLAKMEESGDFSTKAVKAHKSVVKGNRAAPAKGKDARPRTTREIRHTMTGLNLALAAAKSKAETERLTAILTTLTWALSEEYPEGGEEAFGNLMEALAIGSAEAKGLDGGKAKETNATE